MTSGWPRAVPTFAADPEALLTELERWREFEFEGDLMVEYVPRSMAKDERVRGWYDPEKQRLMVVKEESSSLDRETLVRALVHALQDQRFGLAGLLAGAPDVDAARAATAMIEGLASLAVSELLPYELGRRATLPARGPIAPQRFEDVFNRDAGQRFVLALRDAGGWEQVDAAFRDPPRRTAEILRPELYLGQTRASDEAELFTAWRLTPYVVSKYHPLGAYEVHRFLATSELLRPRAGELAGTVVAGKSVREPETTWIVLLSDPEAAQAMLGAVWTAGARTVEALSPDPRMISFRPPALFLEPQP